MENVQVTKEQIKQASENLKAWGCLRGKHRCLSFEASPGLQEQAV